MTNPARARPTTRKKAGRHGVADARASGINTSSKASIALVDENKPLTELEKAFVKFWASGDSPATAASRAGVQNSYAFRLIYKPNVLKAYRIEKEAYEAASGMNRKRVIDGFLEAIEIAKTMAEPSTMVAGWREVGKMCGYYEPVQIKHTVNVEGKILHEKLDKMSDAELMELMEARMRQIAQDTASLTHEGAPHDDSTDADELTGDDAS